MHLREVIKISQAFLSTPALEAIADLAASSNRSNMSPGHRGRQAEHELGWNGQRMGCMLSTEAKKGISWKFDVRADYAQEKLLETRQLPDFGPAAPGAQPSSAPKKLLLME